MKISKILPILLLLMFTLGAEPGIWRFEPLFTRLSDGTLIPPGRAYSAPFMGIEEIVFIDEYLVRIEAGGREHRAFYEFLSGDADNSSLFLTFKGGEVLSIQTVPDGGTGDLLFHYDLPESFFDFGKGIVSDTVIEQGLGMNPEMVLESIGGGLPEEDGVPAILEGPYAAGAFPDPAGDGKELEKDDSESMEMIEIRQISGRLILF